MLQVRNSVETAVAEKVAATTDVAFNFGTYMKERAQLVNEALDKSVPLQYPEIINESMRYDSCTPCAHRKEGDACCMAWRRHRCISR